MSDLSSLLPALSSFLERAGASPIKLEVALCDSDELQEYKSKVQELEATVALLQAQYNRVELMYRSECQINMALTDFCREKGVDPPSHLFRNHK